MSYRVTDNINLPFKIVPLVHEFGNQRVEMNIKLKSLFEKNLFATNVIIKVPCPPNTQSALYSPAVVRQSTSPTNKV